MMLNYLQYLMKFIVLVLWVVIGKLGQGGYYGGEEIVEGLGIDYVVVDFYQCGGQDYGYINV